MRAITTILEVSKPHVKNLLTKHFPLLEFEIGNVSYYGKVPFELIGDVKHVNQFFRLYYMYEAFLVKKAKYCQTHGC